MMIKRNHSLLLAVYSLALCMLLLPSCKKTDDTAFTAAEDYFPIAVGKSFSYRLDSVKPMNFGTRLDTFYYQAKDTVVAEFKDNLNRTSYRVYRYTRDTSATKPWQYQATYVITKGDKTIEVIDNNLRFIKLASPVSEGFKWKGNTYIDTKSAGSLYKYLDEWNYEYMNVGLPFTTRKGRFDNTVTVFQQESYVQEGPFNPAYFDQRTYSVEVYAKGVGLIYKRFLFWEWQTTPNPHFTDESNGLYMNLIDYK